MWVLELCKEGRGGSGIKSGEGWGVERWSLRKWCFGMVFVFFCGKGRFFLCLFFPSR